MLNKIFLPIFSCLFLINFSYASTIKVVAAENFYGELAKEIGGDAVSVQSIISNPDADPHLFTTAPEHMKSLNEAQIIIFNGVNYDPWMEQILQSLNNKHAIIINVADLVQVTKNNVNPHIWYMPNTFPRLAKSLADQIISLDPKSKSVITKNLNKFLSDYQSVLTQIAQIKTEYGGTKVTATEPVFGYLASSMGFDMKGLDVQWKIMNNTEPTPQMLAAYENLLTKKQVKILFYNQQVADPVTANILAIAKNNQISIVGVTETMPQGKTIIQWLNDEITKTKMALKANK